ncbi:MAG: hypothetical protein ACREMQ_15565 [Longimicrobiales bacterium]
MKPSRWVNSGPDEAALPALLERVTQRLPIDTIDEVWIFPTRRAAGTESTVIVVATFDDDPDRRCVNTAHFTATRDKNGQATVREKMDQHAIAPAGAVAKVVEGVLRRVGDELSLPLAESIAGDQQRWTALMRTLGGAR